MKHIITLIAVLSFLIVNGQNNNTNVKVEVKSQGWNGAIMEKSLSDRERAGLYYIGKGVYEIIECGKKSTGGS